jgi:hypothetical protein
MSNLFHILRKNSIDNLENHANIIETKDTEEIVNKINSENEKSTLIHDKERKTET